jgi:valyl-tRNA synthetase
LQDINFSDIPELLPVDRWIIERTNKTITESAKLLYNYEIGSARHEIDTLFWDDFCDNYIEIVKERLYRPDIHGIAERRSGQYALYYSLLNILKLYSVYVPHITEYFYQEFFRKYEKEKSIHLLKWEKPLTTDVELLEFGEHLKKIISDVRKYKSENNLSRKTEMEKLEIQTGKYQEWFEQAEKDIKACVNVKEIIFQ